MCVLINSTLSRIYVDKAGSELSLVRSTIFPLFLFKDNFENLERQKNVFHCPVKLQLPKNFLFSWAPDEGQI